MFGFTLCADDYAMTDGISRGILKLITAGRITATGAMTNRPHWLDYAREVAPLAGVIDVGLHLNLTCAAPLTEMRRFAAGGTLPRLADILALAAKRQLPSYEIIAEINAQLDVFEEALGRAPDYIDGHQHVHGMPGIRDLFLGVITRRYAGDRRPWIRISADRPGRIAARRQFAAKAAQVAALGAGFRSRVEKAGFRTNEGFAGFSGFDPAANYAEQFSSYLVAPGARHLVMCHPGYVDEELPTLDPVLTSRERELEFFLSPEFEGICRSVNCRQQRMTCVVATHECVATADL